MGAPPAPPWATVFFGIHETNVLARFQRSLQLYRRFIDDVIGLWLCHDDSIEDEHQWSDFVELMNDYHGLEWDFTPRGKKVDFMDLTIRIEGDRLVTSLYEKPLNLYLYIPPHSAHPPGVLKGLVSGNTLRIYALCSEQSDIDNRIRQFYRRLLVRGYQRDKLVPAFTKGISRAKAFIARGCTQSSPIVLSNEEEKRVFFHLQYHPSDPSSRRIQRLWRHHVLQPSWERPLWLLKNDNGHPIGVRQLCVAYSRPPNLGNLFSYRKIDNLAGPPVSSYLE